jgi:hypothetical protein
MEKAFFKNLRACSHGSLENSRHDTVGQHLFAYPICNIRHTAAKDRRGANVSRTLLTPLYCERLA